MLLLQETTGDDSKKKAEIYEEIINRIIVDNIILSVEAAFYSNDKYLKI